MSNDDREIYTLTLEVYKDQFNEATRAVLDVLARRLAEENLVRTGEYDFTAALGEYLFSLVVIEADKKLGEEKTDEILNAIYGRNFEAKEGAKPLKETARAVMASHPKTPSR